MVTAAIFFTLRNITKSIMNVIKGYTPPTSPNKNNIVHLERLSKSPLRVIRDYTPPTTPHGQNIFIKTPCNNLHILLYILPPRNVVR